MIFTRGYWKERKDGKLYKARSREELLEMLGEEEELPSFGQSAFTESTKESWEK